MRGQAIKGRRTDKKQGRILLSRLFLIMVLAAGLAACASTASESGATDNGSATSTASSEPKKRCYREKETGTRLGRRVCVTVDN